MRTEFALEAYDARDERLVLDVLRDDLTPAHLIWFLAAWPPPDDLDLLSAEFGVRAGAVGDVCRMFGVRPVRGEYFVVARDLRGEPTMRSGSPPPHRAVFEAIAYANGSRIRSAVPAVVDLDVAFDLLDFPGTIYGTVADPMSDPAFAREKRRVRPDAHAGVWRIFREMPEADECRLRLLPFDMGDIA